MEDINGRSSVFGTLHCGVNPGGPVQRVDRDRQRRARLRAAARPASTPTRCEIDRSTSPEQIRCYLDGANYFTVTATRVDATTWADAVDHPFFIIYDLAIGGGFPDAFGGGPNAATVSGGTMIIDSVAVYNKGPATGGGGGRWRRPRDRQHHHRPGRQVRRRGGRRHRRQRRGRPALGLPVRRASTSTGRWSGQRLRTLGRCLDVDRRPARPTARSSSSATATAAARRVGAARPTARCGTRRPAAAWTPPRAPPPTAPGCRSGTATAPPPRASPWVVERQRRRRHDRRCHAGQRPRRQVRRRRR